MPRQTCTICKERKSIDLFPKDSRYASGYVKQCKACKNSDNRRKVKCPNCDGAYARADLPKHMKTKKCISGELEWKHPMKNKNRFKSDGKEYVTCPCKHEQCQVEIKESTAYRHMKYGIGYKFPAELKRLKESLIEHRYLPVHTINDSDSERDL